MLIKANDTKGELLSVFHSIEEHPGDWAGWMCLHLEIFDPAQYAAAFSMQDEIESCVLRHIGEFQGMAFVTRHGDLYIFVKNAPEAALRKTGESVSRLLKNGKNTSSNFKVWVLERGDKISTAA